MVDSLTGQHNMAVRLEQAREATGLSLAAWYDRLERRDGFDMVYETVRRYHKDSKREPSASYLAFVAREFGVSLEWLLLEHGPMKSKELGRVEESAMGMDEFLPKLEPGFFAIAGPAAITAMHHALFKVLESLPPGEMENLLAEDVAEMAARLIRLAGGPMRVLFFRNPPSYDTVTHYYQNVFQATTMSTPGHGQGKPFNELMGALNAWASPIEEENNA